MRIVFHKSRLVALPVMSLLKYSHTLIAAYPVSPFSAAAKPESNSYPAAYCYQHL